jgi:hypothetical protein
MNDCIHDWRVVVVGENSETTGYRARCILCGLNASPYEVNEQIELLQAENASAIGMLDCYAGQISDLTAEIESMRFCLAGWRRAAKCYRPFYVAWEKALGDGDMQGTVARLQMELSQRETRHEHYEELVDLLNNISEENLQMQGENARLKADLTALKGKMCKTCTEYTADCSDFDWCQLRDIEKRHCVLSGFVYWRAR